MELRHIPNILTILRMILIIPFGLVVMRGEFHWALLLFFFAGVSDLADGYLARRYNWTSRLGGFLDPAADKMLMTISYLAMAWQNVVPWWLVWIVIGRDLVIVLGASAYHLLTRRLEMQPLFVSKLNTGLQLMLILYMLWQMVFGWFPEWMGTGMIYLVALTSLASGIAYVSEWSKRAKLFKERVL